MAKRATKAEAAERGRVIYEMVLCGTPRYDMLRFAKEKWDISPRAVDAYIKKAGDQIEHDADKIQKNALKQHLAQRQLLLYKANQAGDHRLVLEVLRDAAKMQGLYPSATTKNLNIDLDKIDLDKLTDAQLESLARGEIPYKSIRLEPVLDWDDDDPAP